MKTFLALTIATVWMLSASLSGLAFAQDKPDSAARADKGKVEPSAQDIKPYPATVDKMDANAQRIHDRDTGTSQPDSKSDSQGGDKVKSSQSGQSNQQGGDKDGSQQSSESNAQGSEKGGSAQETRDWAAIDENNDNLISPDEMQAALDASSKQDASATAKN